MKIHKICFALFRFKLLNSTCVNKQITKQNNSTETGNKIQLIMTTIPQILILVFLTTNFRFSLTEDTETLQHAELIEEIHLRNTTPIHTSHQAIKVVEEIPADNTVAIEEFTTKLVILESEILPDEKTVSEKPILNLNKDEEVKVTITRMTDNEEKSDNSFETLTEESTTISVPEEVTTKPLISLEDYAVKQMNFILDHLLIEIQEFVAKVLQASVNSVFQRNHLKRYAENLNRILNPDTTSDYSDETMDNKPLTQEELYNQVMRKINFVKSKSTIRLQSLLPQDWVHEYKNKRTEITIWLDKACEQMHKEFNRYVSDEDDHIKYQYFNEAFDDISRATEIHQKLALLADLIKIVKNKKQITFMDLYMQT